MAWGGNQEMGGRKTEWAAKVRGGEGRGRGIEGERDIRGWHFGM